MNNHKHKQYLRTQIQTASKEQLVLMLFDGAIRFCEQGKKHMQDNKIEDAHTALTKAQEVVKELLYAVDREKGGEIAENLVRLYSYALICLVEANMTRKIAKAEEVQNIIRELREGWIGAMEKTKAETQAGKPDNQARLQSASPAAAVPQNSPDTVALSSTQESTPTPRKPRTLSLPKPGQGDKPGFLATVGLGAGLQPRLSVQG